MDKISQKHICAYPWWGDGLGRAGDLEKVGCAGSDCPALLDSSQKDRRGCVSQGIPGEVPDPKSETANGLGVFQEDGSPSLVQAAHDNGRLCWTQCP